MDHQTNIHPGKDTPITVERMQGPFSGTNTLRFGDLGANVTVFLGDADLRRLRDTLSAHLGDTETVEYLTAEGDTVLVEEPAQ